jgi:hypothetical protein
VPRLVILRAEAEPADLLALSAPFGHIDVKRRRKTVAVKRALYLGRNPLLDGEPEEWRLVGRKADAARWAFTRNSDLLQADPLPSSIPASRAGSLLAPKLLRLEFRHYSCYSMVYL